MVFVRSIDAGLKNDKLIKVNQEDLQRVLENKR